MKKKPLVRKHEGINLAERIGARAYAHTCANKHSARAVIARNKITARTGICKKHTHTQAKAETKKKDKVKQSNGGEMGMLQYCFKPSVENLYL